MRPKNSRMGRARAKVTSSPPHITVSVPASAPETPPLTGASMNAMPRSASRAAMRRELAGSPEVQSMRSVPADIPARRPSGPSSSPSTSREVGRQVMTTAASVAAAAGVGAAAAPVAVAKAVAVSAVRFQTASVELAATWRAMGVPMAPSPRKAVFILLMSPRRIVRGRASMFLGMISILHIDGMRTVHCVRAVFTALGGVAGVERAEVIDGARGGDTRRTARARGRGRGARPGGVRGAGRGARGAAPSRPARGERRSGGRRVRTPNAAASSLLRAPATGRTSSSP